MATDDLGHSRRKAENQFRCFLKSELDKVLDNVTGEFQRVHATCGSVQRQHDQLEVQSVSEDAIQDSPDSIPNMLLSHVHQRKSHSDLIIQPARLSNFEVGEIAGYDEDVVDIVQDFDEPCRSPPDPLAVQQFEEPTLGKKSVRMDEEHSPHVSEGNADAVKVLDIWLRSGSLHVSHSSAILQHRPLSCISEAAGSFESSGSYSLPLSDVNRRVSTAMNRFMMHPNSKFVVMWEFQSLAWIIWDLVLIPFETYDRTDSFRQIILWLKTLFWTFDMPLACFIEYTEMDGTLITSIPLVTRKYIRTRFPIDIVLVVCSWMALLIRSSNSGDDSTISDVATAMIVVQLIRLYRLVFMYRLLEKMLIHVRGEGTLIMIYMSLVVTLFVTVIHIMSCMWYWISDGEGVIPTDKLADRYILSLHTVLALVVGEHVMMPRTFEQRLFMVCMLLFGFIMSAAFVGSLTTAMTRLQLLARQQSTYFASLNRYLTDNKISNDLAIRIYRNARHALALQKSTVQEKDVQLLELVSAPLKAELHYEIYARHLFHHPFLRLFNDARPRAIQTICDTAVSQMYIYSGDVLFSAQEKPERPTMFVCNTGSLKYIPLEGMAEYVTGSENSFISEAALWADWYYRGTMRAFEESHLLLWDAITFGKIIRKTDLPHAKRYAVEFVAHMNNVGDPTDIGLVLSVLRLLAVNVFRNEDEHFQAPAEWGFSKQGSSKLWNRSSMVAPRLSVGSLLGHMQRHLSLEKVVP